MQRNARTFCGPMSRSQQLGCFPTSCAFAFGQKQRLVHKSIFESRMYGSSGKRVALQAKH